jgi:hypothetical protein
MSSQMQSETMHIDPQNDYKAQARRLRTALADDGVAVSHSRSLELVARLHGARDWNTLAAAAQPKAASAPFAIGDRVTGTFNESPAQGRVIGLSETIKPELWRVTVAFDPPVDVVTSKLFSSERRRIQMIIGADGRSRRLTGTETGVMALRHA